MTVMSNILADLAKFFITIHHTARDSGLEHQAVQTIQDTAKQALSKINQHSNGLVDEALGLATQTAEEVLGTAPKGEGQ